MKLNLTNIFLSLLASAVLGSGIGYSKLYLFHIILIVFAFSWIYFQGKGKKQIFFIPKTPYVTFWYVFFFWYAISIFWSIDLIYTLKYIFYLVIGITIIFLINSFVVSKERYIQCFDILKTFFILAIFVALLESFTSFRLPTSPYSEYANFFDRKQTDLIEFETSVQALIKSAPTSFWGNPNNLSVAMAMVGPFFFSTKSLIWRFAGTISIIIIIIMSGSRGAFIGLILGLAVFVAINGFRYALKALIFILIPLIIISSNIDILKQSQNSRVADLAWTGEALYSYLFEKNEGLSSVGARQALINNGLDALWKTNGLGVGGGGSQAVQEQIGGVGGKITSMHNFWAEVLVEGGVFMFSLFALWYAILCYRLYIIYKLCKNVYFKNQAGSLLVAQISFLVAAVSASSVIYFFPMWLMFGMSIALIRLHSNKYLIPE